MKQLMILISIILILSCTNNNPKTITLSTNLVEFIPFIDDFNQNNNDIKIIINSDSQQNSDLVIFKGQKDRVPFPTQRIDDLLHRRLNKDDFYKDILKSVTNSNGEIYVLPLTFDIQGLIYNDKIKNPSLIDIDKFTNKKEMIFSPFWDKNFIMWYYLSSLPELTLENSYNDKDVFYITSKAMINMITNRDDKWNINAFNNKYMHLSPELLINKSIIDYYFYSLSKYIKNNKSDNKNISFAALYRNGLIPIKDEMTYIGINENCKNNNTARDVITWMFQIENQEKFIKKSFKESSVYHLFNNDLSTLKNITMVTLPIYYPEITQIVQNSNLITVPSNLPLFWDSLKELTYKPILQDIITLEETKWSTKYFEYYEDWSKKHNK